MGNPLQRTSTFSEGQPAPPPPGGAVGNEETSRNDDVETVVGESVTIDFGTKRCIHARFCVIGAPQVILANVEGPWIHPNAMDGDN